MGNHDVGRGMSAGAKGFWIGNGDSPVDKEKALKAMDEIASDYVGADAEFDDELTTDTPLSRLLCIAFEASEQEALALKGDLPDGVDDDDVMESFYEGTYSKFRQRYNFC